MKGMNMERYNKVQTCDPSGSIKHKQREGEDES
jgi:hypothetical protein